MKRVVSIALAALSLCIFSSCTKSNVENNQAVQTDTAAALVLSETTSAATISEEIPEIKCDYTFRIRNDSLTVYEYVGSETSVVIPSEIDGYSVTYVNVNTFSGTDVTEVT